jgi:thiosulfate dehydrogenase (quinone) large subunit
LKPERTIGWFDPLKTVARAGCTLGGGDITMADSDARTSKRLDLLAACARLALAASFLTAVADRLGQYGSPGTPGVAWGDMQHFQAYARRLNPWFPASVIPFLSWFVTAAETLLGLSLIAGYQIRRVAPFSGALLLAFAIGMTAGTGLRSALYASVLSASACAFLLRHHEPDSYTLDHLMMRVRTSSITRPGASIHYAAAAWAALFAAPHLWWALGVPAGFPGGRAGHELMMTTWRFKYDVAVIGSSVLAIVVALAPIRPWGDAVPRPVLRVMAVAASFMLTLRGVAGLIADGASDLVWWPTFLIGGLLFGAVALSLASGD